MKDEPLMNLRPQSDAEKLLWEREKSKQLTDELKSVKLELGIVQSELEELKHTMKQSEVGALVIKNRVLKATLQEKEHTIKEQKREIETLFDRIVKLQTPPK